MRLCFPLQAAQSVAEQASECVAALEALMAEKQGLQSKVCAYLRALICLLQEAVVSFGRHVTF